MPDSYPPRHRELTCGFVARDRMVTAGATFSQNQPNQGSRTVIYALEQPTYGQNLGERTISTPSAMGSLFLDFHYRA